MANTKISALPAAATITGTEIVPLVQAGATVAATVQQLLALSAPPANGTTIDDTTTSTAKTWSSAKSAAVLAPLSAATTAAAGTHRYLALEAEDNSDLNELWDGDSVGNETIEHIYLLTALRAAQNPTRTYIYHLIDQTDGLSWGAPVTVQTGTGTKNTGAPYTTHIWNFSVTGKATWYGLGSRYPLLTATTPNIVVILHGKNEGSVAGGLKDANWRGQYLALTETLKRDIPFADIVSVLQFPDRDENDMAAKNTVYAQLGAMLGHGIINLHDAFLAAVQTAGGTLSDYYKSDGIHPTTSADAPKPDASTLLATLELPYWTYNRAAGTIRPRTPSALDEPSDEILANAKFSAYTSAVPDSWSVTGGTVSKDNRAGFFESANGYGVRLQPTGAASCFLYQYVTNYAAYKNRWVTLTVRQTIPSAVTTSTAGRIALADGVQTVTSQGPSNARDGYLWHTISMKVSANPTYLRVFLYGDTAANATADITYDRVHLVAGVLPRQGSSGVPGPAGPTGNSTAGQVDFMSTLGNMPAYAATASGGQQTHQFASSLILMNVRPFRNVSLAFLQWFTGTTLGTNYDIAVYDTTGTRLWSKGTTAWPAANTSVVETVSPPLTLVAGTDYWIGLGSDTTTGQWRGAIQGVSGVLTMLGGTKFARTQSSSFPAPATITIAGTESARLPLIVLREA